MVIRFWDKENKYRGAVLWEHKYWVLETSYKQHTFGCYIIFCKREGVEKISELSVDELTELKQVFKEIENALLKNNTFCPDRFNYWQMGNGLHQLHFHGIPRYSSERKFAGKIWKDNSFGTVPIWAKQEESADMVKKLRNEIKKFL